MRAITAGRSTSWPWFSTPYSSECLTRCATRALFTTALVGTHPQYRQSPQSLSRSTKATLVPRDAAPAPETNPAVPPPIATRSYLVVTNRNALYKLLHDARKNLKRRIEAEGLSAKEVLEALGDG